MVVCDAEVEAPVNLGIANFNENGIFTFFQPDGQDVTVRCSGTFDIFGKELLAVKPKGAGVVSAEAELGGNGLGADNFTTGISANPVGRREEFEKVQITFTINRSSLPVHVANTAGIGCIKVELLFRRENIIEIIEAFTSERADDFEGVHKAQHIKKVIQVILSDLLAYILEPAGRCPFLF